MQKIWKLLDPAPATFLEEHPELPNIVANLLYHRGIITQSQIDEFLDPDYSQNVHDPYLFKDMEKTVTEIFLAIKNKDKIVVHGDYDADGVSASVILVSTLKILGCENCEVFLPHRETDGYGLNVNTINKLSENGTKLIITCDCGVSNATEIELANSLGMKVIVTDHHAVPEILPPAFSIIHPKVPGETYPDKGLAGGGVAFKVMQGLLKKYHENYVVESGPTLGWEKWLLDMVAIASVADMVPLLGESRTLTKYGLIVLNKTKRIGLQKLLLEARLIEEDGTTKYDLSADTIGFQIAPRINAAGRMNHANVAYNLMMTENPEEATELAHDLDKNNQDRQKVTEDLVKEAVRQAEIQKDQPILFILGAGWSTGIVGLIASKIKERYYKPTIVMAENAKPCTEQSSGTVEEITGSGRSIPGFDLIGAIQKIPEFFYKFGGHPMACGFTLKNKEELENFKTALINIFNDTTARLDLKPSLAIDAEIDLDQVTWELYDVLDKFKPFGQANEKPKYIAKELTVAGLEPVGKTAKHLRIMVKHNSHKIRKTIGWNLCTENNDQGIDWGKELKVGDKIDLVFEIEVNQWNGNRELQLTIVDLKKL